jgi:hypothetical protein
MDDTHLAVVHLVRDRSTAGAKHAAVEIAVVHAQHHATYILVVMPALPNAGIGTLVDEGLQNSLTPIPSPKFLGVITFAAGVLGGRTIYSPLLGRGDGGEAPRVSTGIPSTGSRCG